MRHSKLFFLALMAMLCPVLHAAAQSVPSDVGGWTKRLSTFCSSLPQEQVFVHMDNTGYYIGDTIYFKAYVTLGSGAPSRLSGLLYCELLNNDGYIVERQKIKLTQGQGHGCFVLTDSLYGGFYELRAYTRWQLNWGVTEHPHTARTGKWFYTKQMQKEFFRDFDKLYSRVFPVYDKPRTPGAYNQNMTMRPMQRYFKTKYEKPQAVLTFFPEGGCLVEGAVCRVAFEANDPYGKHLKGKLIVRDGTGKTLAETATESRGRSTFLLDVAATESYTAEFTWGDGYTATAQLPKAEADGVALVVSGTEAGSETPNITATVQARGAARRELGYTVMCQGAVKASGSLGTDDSQQITIDRTALPNGVAQLTVFDAQGRVWADRLFFVRGKGFAKENIGITGCNEAGYEAFEKVKLGIDGTPGATVSVAVRDAGHLDYTFDSGNILTEMLLASQIKGFVEQPEYYFEADDEEHRRALDLLLLVQGWRRYDWHTMTSPGAFALNEPYEKTEWIYGDVNKVEDEKGISIYETLDFSQLPADKDDPEYVAMKDSDPACRKYFSLEFVKRWRNLETARMAARVLYYQLGQPDLKAANDLEAKQYADRIVQGITTEILKQYEENAMPAGTLKDEVTVHAEFMLDHKVKSGDGEMGAAGDMMTYRHGQFRIEAPAFDGYCFLFCGASDQTKWKAGKPHTWIDDAELKADDNGENGLINNPEFYVRLKQPFPRFVKPYNFYQTATSDMPLRLNDKLIKVDDVTVLREVVIGANRNGNRGLNLTKPALVLDAYEAFNEVTDAGMCPGYYLGATRFARDVARNYVGDMNNNRNYETMPDEQSSGETFLKFRFNTKRSSDNIPDRTLAKYDHLHFLDKVYIYTDYAPRLEGDPRYSQSNQPEVTVDLRRFEDGSRFATYRDRHKVLWGFSVCTDFYNPDYSARPTDPNDYRRTLYWNPDLTLDGDGHADVTFFNNNSHSKIAVDVEGIAPDGTLQTGTK